MEPAIVGQSYKLSCRHCRARKVKCDRILPCAPCTRSGLDCAFPKPLRTRRQSPRDAEITKRLGQLERLVGQLGGSTALAQLQQQQQQQKQQQQQRQQEQQEQRPKQQQSIQDPGQESSQPSHTASTPFSPSILSSYPPPQSFLPDLTPARLPSHGSRPAQNENQLPTPPGDRGSDTALPRTTSYTSGPPLTSWNLGDTTTSPINASSPLSGDVSSDGGVAVKHERERASASPTVVELREQQPIVKHDGKLYLGSDFWANISGEVEGLRQLLHEPSDDDDEDEDEDEDIVIGDSDDTQTAASTLPADGDIKASASLLFDRHSNEIDLRDLHAPTAHLPLLVQAWIQRVDPILRMLHRPSLLRLIAAVATSGVSKTMKDSGEEALLFAFYFLTVTSMPDHECRQRFQQDRATLLQRYKTGVETAMSDAQLLTTTQLPVLQAFIMYLMAMRTISAADRSTWTLFALAARIAQALELYVDPSHLSLPPFESEMRRRTWAYLSNLDGMHSSDRGTVPILHGIFSSVRSPLNVNDDDLSPNMTVPAVAREGRTEMTFALLCLSASSSTNRLSRASTDETYLNQNPDLDPDAAFARRKAIVTEHARFAYSLAHLPSSPNGYMDGAVSMVALASSSRIWLLLRYPIGGRRQLINTQIRRETGLAVATAALEISQNTWKEPGVAHIHWYGNNFVAWHAIAVALAELCVLTQGPLVDRAWHAVEISYKTWGARVADTRHGALWRPIKKLLDKARQARMDALGAQFALSLNLNESNSPSDSGLPHGKRGSMVVSYTTPSAEEEARLHNAAFELAKGETEQIDLAALNLVAQPATVAAVAPIASTSVEPTFSAATGLFNSDGMDPLSAEPFDWNDWSAMMDTSVTNASLMQDEPLWPDMVDVS